MKEITITLTIDQIQIAYGAVNRCAEISLIAAPILEILDVEEFKDNYDLTFTATEFENVRISVKQMLNTFSDQGFDIKEITKLLKYLNNQRNTLLE